jgi:transcriptional regulator with XRE-family HTH domain
MELIEHVAQKIRELRENYNSGEGISQSKLAELLNVATNTISRWETGNYKPSIEDIDKLSKIFGVSILVFFPDSISTEDDLVFSFRASDGLSADDINEIKNYVEFRKARSIYNRKKVNNTGIK